MTDHPKRQRLQTRTELAPWIFLIVALATPARAATPPAVDSIFPAGGQRGTTVVATVTGKFDAWPVKGWADSAGIVIEAGKKAGEVTVKIAKDAAPGPHLFRLYTADGASAPRCFFVGDQAELNEAEPNDEFAAPQVVKALPITINGQLDKPGDVDCFAVELAAGQTLVASVQARRLGAGIDPMLHLFGPAGTQVAFAHDGLGLDPLLVFRAEKGGRYVVRVSAFAFPPAADVKLYGGKNAPYRLSLTTGAYVRATMPIGVPRGRKTAVRAIGWNLATDMIEVDATDAAADADHVEGAAPTGEARVRVELADGAEVVEPAAGQAPLAPFVAPAAVNGVIAVAGEEDRFPFAAKKGERLVFAMRAASAGSALEPVLTVRDGAGKSLATTGENQVSGEPRLEWAAPADGTFFVCVADLFRNAGPVDSTIAGGPGAPSFYRVSVSRVVPEITATLGDDAYALAPGKTAAVKLKIGRHNGYVTPMIAAAVDLPSGVTAPAVEIPAKAVEVTITLTAAADAKAAYAPFRVLLLSSQATAPAAEVATIDLTKEVEKVGGQSYIERIAAPWLTVSATASAEKPKAK